MADNQCGYPLRPAQDSGVFNKLSLCQYKIVAISSKGDSTVLDEIKLGMQASTLLLFICKSTPQKTLLRQFYIDHGKPPFRLQIKKDSSFISGFTFITNDSVFSLQDTFFDNAIEFWITDACNNLAVIKKPMDHSNSAFLDRKLRCDDSQVIFFPIVSNFANRPLVDMSYTWKLDTTIVSHETTVTLNGDQNGHTIYLELNNKSCDASLSYTFTKEPSRKINLSITKDKVALCGSDSILLTVQSGQSYPIQYHWNTNDTNQFIKVKSAGNYSLKATNSFGCFDSGSISIRQSTPVINSTVTQNLCFSESNGKIDLTLSGGIVPYNYLWNDRSNTEDRVNLDNGNYSVKVKDSAGCTINASFNINSPPPLLLSLSARAADCIPAHNGKVTTMAGGGVPPYRYQWNNGLTVPNVDTLSPGSYTVTLIDTNQCTRSFQFRIDNLNPFRMSRIDTICANTTLIVGKSSYGISGRYSDSLKSIKGCDSIVTTYLTVNAPIDFILKASDPTCNGLDDGRIAISDIVGFPSYTYMLNNRLITIAQFSKIPSGNYVFKVNDRFNCIREKGFALTNPEKINFSLGRDTIIPFGDTLNITPITNLKASAIKQISWSTSPLQSNCILCNAVYKYRPTDDHTLKATIESITGCKVSDDINVKVNHDFKVYVPNIFIPANALNQENQSLTIYGGRLVEKINYFRIFNRYGDEVYEVQHFLPNDRSVAWDGKYKGSDAPQDIYVYVAEVVFGDGSVRVMKGDVVLVR